jgi:hypothetical protein
MTQRPQARHVHLVGTVPMASSRQVFSTVGKELGPYLKRIPDGETGVRGYWITSQARVLHYHPAFEPADHDWNPESGAPPESSAPKYRLRKGVDPKTVELSSFGYGEFARISYGEFKRAKAEGLIQPETRFQVSLPTPMAFYLGIVAPESREVIAPAMEARITQELRDILEAVPHEDLSIQWDVCLEMYIWEGVREIFFSDAKQGCLDRLIALGDLVPEPVELGYHFCYGDFRHAHAVEPKDMQNMVTMANGIVAGARRQVNFFHMPVPRNRDDDSYFAPLKNLKIQLATEIYLGLVHHTDGEAGTLRRMAAADRAMPQGYGISTECGWGRREKSTIPELIHIHAFCAGRTHTT